MKRFRGIAQEIASPTRSCTSLGIFHLSLACLLVSCASPDGSQSSASIGAMESPETVTSTRVSPKLRDVVEALHAAGITSANARQRNADDYSTSFVKVNNAGAIQVHVKVRDVDSSTIAVLEQNGMQIELYNESLGLIQGWVPYDRIDNVASLGFVERVTPPDYVTSS